MEKDIWNEGTKHKHVKYYYQDGEECKQLKNYNLEEISRSHTATNHCSTKNDLKANNCSHKFPSLSLLVVAAMKRALKIEDKPKPASDNGIYITLSPPPNTPHTPFCCLYIHDFQIGGECLSSGTRYVLTSTLFEK